MTPGTGESADTTESSARTLILAVYILQAAGLAVALTPVIGIIINHVKLNEMRGTVYESHCRWQIRTFWWGLFWLVAGSSLVPLMGAGFLVLALATLWYLYRIVRGFLNWNDRVPMPVGGD